MMNLLKLFRPKSKVKLGKAERYRINALKLYNQNENNIAVQEKFLKCLEDNKGSDPIKIVYTYEELLYCSLDYTWFEGITKHILGDNYDIRVCDDVNFTKTILVKKVR